MPGLTSEVLAGPFWFRHGIPEQWFVSGPEMNTASVQTGMLAIGVSFLLVQIFFPANRQSTPDGEVTVKALANAIITTILLSMPGIVLAFGQKVYEGSCQRCHATGADGAPRLGDREAWAPRIAQGMEVLIVSVRNGKGAMPPRGACMSCTDTDLKDAVEYIVNRSQ